MTARVLVFGAAGAGRRSLCRALAGAAAPEEAWSSQALGIPFRLWPLTLRTKYYTAELELLVETEAASLLMAGAEAAAVGAEGAVLVMDASAPDADAALAQYGDYLGGLGVAVRLLVATHWDCVAEGAEELAVRWRLWALDRQCELITANVLQPAAGGDAREKTGVPRVVEALQSHLWSTARMREGYTRPSGAGVYRMAPPPSAGKDSGSGSGSSSREPETPKPKPRIRILGAPQTGKRSLAAQLLGRELPAGERVFPWTLCTRYFTVDVDVELGGPASGSGSPAEAVVLCFDLEREDTFEALAQFEAAAAAPEAVVKLCVGSRADVAGEGAAYSAHVLWCLDRELEYVEADCTQPGDRESRDKEGVARVLEALGSHAWSAASYTTPARPMVDPGPPVQSPDAVAGAEAAEEPEEPEPAAPEPEREPAAMAASKSSVGGAGALGTPEACAACGRAPPADAALMRCGRCRRAFYCNQTCQKTHWRHHRGQCRELSSSSGGGGGSAGSAGPAQAEEDEDEAAMRKLAALERMVDEARAVRERGTTLSDAQRREAAASAAERLWAMMGGSDSEGEG